MRILITGGAGFVGSHLAVAFRRHDPDGAVLAFDNLRRRGSELNLSRLRQAGVSFVHGDIRCGGDLRDVPGRFDLIVDASAEPSVHAGLVGSPRYVIDTNLVGTIRTLELASRRAGAFVFLSTSRVYSVAPLRALELRETETRFELAVQQATPGVSACGVAETFRTDLPRSLYGATKLASELLVQEYAESLGLPAIIDRCGVIAGPGQFGKVDQGVFTMWVASHLFGLPISYTGFGGRGLQVRDILHPDDLFALLLKQVSALPKYSGEVFNAGGGPEGSVSLREWTGLCREATGVEVPVAEVPESPAVDVPYYVSDHRKACAAYDWSPERDPRQIAQETASWIRTNEGTLAPLFRR
ncbi:NAD-dependent epimerase/dehydratase family protein [Planctomycetota bacterium]